MKQRFICDECGKIYDVKEDALRCETKHAEEKLRQKSLNESREQRKEEIKKALSKYNDLVSSYISDYGKLELSSADISSLEAFFNLF